ncbi:MAG TPA: hypothetical protein VMQ17_26450 [Candidatus Sulfotelmatobacter sp.]|nr:hypothetical protein [Candidatus Sulfotelmatobacter sp.]
MGFEPNVYYGVVGGADHMSFSDGDLISNSFMRDVKPDDIAFENALLRLELICSLTEEFLSTYLKSESAPHLDVTVQTNMQ